MTRKFSSKRPLTAEEEAEIQHMIASDPTNPELTDEQIKGARPFADVFPELAKGIKRARGRPKGDVVREVVSLRLTPDTVDKFKAKGADWRQRMVRALEKAKT